MTNALALNPTQGWQAHLSLGLKNDGERTVLHRREHLGPLRVQRPFYPEGNRVCHVYVLHPPGGVVGGDQLEVDVAVEPNASALLTTPASGKVYRSSGLQSSITQRLHVQEGAELEWLPQDTILFGGSRLRLNTEIRLARGARFSGWEVTTLGRPHFGDDYATGEFEQRTRICVDEVPRLIEQQIWKSGDAVLEAPWGLAGYPVLGTSCTYPADSDALDRARRIIDRNSNVEVSAATLLDDLLVVRVLGKNAVLVRQMLVTVWAGLRKLTMGRAPCMPRIWAT